MLKRQADNQFTLSDLCEIDAPGTYQVICGDDGSALAGLSSYRGFYDDLALEPALSMDRCLCAHTLRNTANAACGEIFHGYKGGEYRADESTLIWVSRYDAAEGRAVVGYTVDHDARRVVLTIKAVD